MATPSTTTQAQRRGELVALFGIALQIFLTVVVLLLAGYTDTASWVGPNIAVDPNALDGGSTALWSECTHLAAGILLWVVLWLVFNQRKRLQHEILETETLRREREMAGASGAIFNVDDDELMLSRRRLKGIYRWLLPGFTIFLALQLALSALTATWPLGRHVADDNWPTVAPGAVNVALGGLVFLALASFIFSRIAKGMARLPQWRMLRAGASYTFGNTLMLFLLAVSLFLNDTPVVEHALTYVIRGLMVLLAIELILNFVLDLYRPRTPDEEPRPAFDSRLLGLLSEPGAVAHSMAEAINYQFGFEVSSTWFYKLLQRAIVPLFGFGAVVLILLSTVVIVEPHERVVIETWGHPHRPADPANEWQVVEVGPGLRFKLPWPIERAYHYPVDKVQVIVLGLHADDDDEDGERRAGKLTLWSEERHWGEEHENILVAAPQSELRTEPSMPGDIPPDALATTRPAAASARAVPVSIIQVVVPMYYTISDVGKYAYKYENPKALLEAVAYRELIALAASKTMDKLMGEEREEAAVELRSRIEARIGTEGLDMGVTLRFVGLDGLHPPHDVAESFEAVVGASIEQETSRLQAEAEVINTQIEVAGSVALADALDAAIAREQSRRREATEKREAGAPEDEIRRLETEADQALAQARGFLLAEGPSARRIGGQAAERILAARADRAKAENAALALVTQFRRELPGYQAAPELYRARRLLGVLAEGLAGVKKYVIAVKTYGPPEIRFIQKTQASELNWAPDQPEDETNP